VSNAIAAFGTDYFLVGLSFGVLAVAIGWGLRWALRRALRPLPIVGLFIAVGTVWTLQIVERTLDPAIVPSLLVIAAGVAVMKVVRTPRWAQPLGALPGAVWLAIGSEATEIFWVRVMFAVLIPVAGYLISDFELRHQGLGLGVIYFALAVLGVFAAVPDTEWALSLLALTLPVTFLAWPRVAASLGPLGSYLAVAVLLWVTASGGEGRPASIVGSAAGLGLLLLEPIVVAIRPSAVRISRRIRRDWRGAVIASIPQIIVVLICSRIAARFTDVFRALAIVSLAFGVVIVIGLRMGSPVGEVEDEDGRGRAREPAD